MLGSKHSQTQRREYAAQHRKVGKSQFFADRDQTEQKISQTCDPQP